MHRLASLVVVGVLALAAATVGTAAGGRPDPPAQTRAEKAAMNARRIGHPASVRVTLADGTKLTGTMTSVGDQDLTLVVTSGGTKGERHIPYADIERIKEKGSRVGLWIALGVTIGVLVPIGICAAAA